MREDWRAKWCCRKKQRRGWRPRKRCSTAYTCSCLISLVGFLFFYYYYCYDQRLVNADHGSNAATLKVTGTLQSSTEILKMTNSLVKLPELSASMRDMSAEMSKAGIMDDMIDDVMGDTEDLDEEEEQEAEGEVDKVLFDITNGKMGAVESASANLPELQSQKKEREQPSQEELEAEERENKRMQEQLNQLLSGQ